MEINVSNEKSDIKAKHPKTGKGNIRKNRERSSYRFRYRIFYCVGRDLFRVPGAVYQIFLF